MTKIQYTGTATQPHRNRKFHQFNNDQYCIKLSIEVEARIFSDMILYFRYKTITRVYMYPKMLFYCNVETCVIKEAESALPN